MRGWPYPSTSSGRTDNNSRLTFRISLNKIRSNTPRHGFRFKNKLYSLDVSTIDLCLSVFPWVRFRTTKGAVKFHVGLDHDGLLPAFMTITDGKSHDITAARSLQLPKASIVVLDCGYNDYTWYNQLNSKGVFFVTRLRKNARYRVTERRHIIKSKGLTSDQTIRFTGTKAGNCPIALRRIGFKDAATGIQYYFLTNNFDLAASTIAEIYKARWQIELFFKLIKQNLKIKSFLGTSKNAVMTQIWIAICVDLLLAYLKFASQIEKSFQQILRLLQLNLFDRRGLRHLLVGDPSEPLNRQLTGVDSEQVRHLLFVRHQLAYCFAILRNDDFLPRLCYLIHDFEALGFEL